MGEGAAKSSQSVSDADVRRRKPFQKHQLLLPHVLSRSP